MPQKQKLFYFGYGLNLNPERCKNWVKVENSRLHGYEWLINQRGVATIKRSSQSSVWGTLFEITEKDLLLLDVFEVYPIEYQRFVHEFKEDDSTKRAWVYIDPITMPGKPKPNYLETVIEGAMYQDLPPGWVDHLRAWSSHSVLA